MNTELRTVSGTPAHIPQDTSTTDAERVAAILRETFHAQALFYQGKAWGLSEAIRNVRLAKDASHWQAGDLETARAELARLVAGYTDMIDGATGEYK